MGLEGKESVIEVERPDPILESKRISLPYTLLRDLRRLNVLCYGFHHFRYIRKGS